MLEAFNIQRRQFAEARQPEQQEANRLCGEMCREIGEILQREGKASGSLIYSIFAHMIRLRGSPMNPSLDQTDLTPDELRRNWTLSKEIAVDGEEDKTITLEAYGGKSPTQANRTFMSIDGALHGIELTKEHGVMWQEKQKQNKFFLTPGEEANIVEARFYRTILDRFQGKNNPPTIFINSR